MPKCSRPTGTNGSHKTTRRSAGLLLPHFFIIGVPKAGTTSLHHYLRQHPQIAMSADKEPHHFVHADGHLHYTGPGDEISTQNDTRTLDAYKAQFSHGRGKLRGEASPQYLADPKVPKRIKKAVPDAKFIVLLRDPAARAFSNYLHMQRMERETESHFEAALEREEERLAAGWEPFWGYRRQSQYWTNLQPWLQVFPKDRFLVITLRDLQADTSGTMARVHAFLGVDDFEADHLIYNPGGVARIQPVHRRLARRKPLKGLTQYVLPKQLRVRLHLAMRRWNSKYPTIKPSTEKRLRKEFLPEIQGVEQAFGMDLGFWKNPEDR